MKTLAKAAAESQTSQHLALVASHTALDERQPGLATQTRVARRLGHHFDAINVLPPVGESDRHLPATSQLGTGMPAIQRNIQGYRDFTNGRLSIDMVPSRRETEGEAYGEEGLIRFRPAPTGEKAEEIELVQSVQVTQNGANKAWTGEEAIREVWKSEDGRFVDVLGEKRQPRYEDGAKVSKAYNADMAGSREPHYAGSRWNTASGSRKVVDVRPGYNRSNTEKKDAELWDHPSFTTPATFAFETEVVARGAAPAIERSWGVVRWGFRTVQIPGESEWRVQNETHSFHEGASASHTAAKTRFDEVMGNTGLLSPENIKEAKRKYVLPETREVGKANISAIIAKVDEYIGRLPHGADGQIWQTRLMELKTRLQGFMTDFQQEELEWAEASKTHKQDQGKHQPIQQGDVPDNWDG